MSTTVLSPTVATAFVKYLTLGALAGVAPEPETARYIVLANEAGKEFMELLLGEIGPSLDQEMYDAIHKYDPVLAEKALRIGKNMVKNRGKS